MTARGNTGRSRAPLIIGGGLVVLLLIAAIAFIYIYVTGGSGEASQAISAPELDAQASASSQAVTFAIVPEESEVRFALQEDLAGQRITVVGRTNQVAGQVLVDFAQPANSQLGVIRINVRTLATDNDFRNRAIRGQILMSQNPENEFTDFVPTSVTGLPESVTLGEAFTFQVTGDLTLRGITSPVTFDVTVTPVSETRIEGSAVATVLRESWNLTIPSVPNVANVSEEVELTIDFVAVAAEPEATEAAG
ncbi:YceI family protein [Anaerolineae bacterium CFX9]|jgi:polyisoprenoid-binding protein YceI|nr:YceI family protein [Anaerolineae bacterium CFX9]